MRRGDVMGETAFKRWLLGAGGLVALLVAAAVLTVLNTRRLNEDAAWVAHTHEVLDELGEISRYLREAEAVQRTYLLTGDRAALPDFVTSLDAAREHVDRVKRLTEDNPGQQARLAELEEQTEGLAGFWSHTIQLRQRQGLDAARQRVTAGKSRRAMADLQGLLRQMEDAERGLLRERSQARERSYGSAVATELLSSLAAVAAVAALTLLLRRHLAARAANAAVIAAQGERLRITLASIGDAVISTDTQGRITTMNAVAESLTGWTSTEATGQPLDTVFRILDEDTRQPVENPATRSLREGVIAGLASPTVLLARDGSERAIDDSAAPIRGEQGRLVGCVLIFRDVSERRRLEKENASRLVAARSLASIVETSEDAVISKSLDGIIRSWNAAAERIFGFTAEEVVGRPIAVIIPDDRAGEEDRILARLRAGERVVPFDTVRRRKDGRAVPVSVSVSPVRDEAGRIIGASKIVRDITARKRAEAAAGEQARLTALRADISTALAKPQPLQPGLQGACEAFVRHLEAAFARIWTLNEAEGVLELQASAGMYTHRDGPHGRIRVGEWEIGRIASSCRPHLTNDVQHDPNVSDPEWARREGMVAFAGYPLLVEGRRVGVMAVFARQPLAEATLADLAALTDQIGQHIERKRAEEELRRVAAELREADQRKDEFLATLAHELRNPLAPIRTSVELLRLGGSANPQLERVRDVVERQVMHMVRLVDDLLEVSRITRGKIELQRERCDLFQVVRNAVETSGPWIEAGRHELSLVTPPEPVVVEGDVVRLTQVVSNLLNNAAKFTPPGGRIGLAVERRGGEAVLRVRDNGPGIPDEMLPRVFELFTQVNDTRKQSQGGLGIGLALVKRLVEMHGGTVEARSGGAGGGAEFIVRLPLVAGVEPGEARHPTMKTEGSGFRCRILVVDDNVDAAESLSLLLKLGGHEVATAHDGASAIERVATFRPEVILLDLGMPGMDGYETARRVRHLHGREGIKLVALTGWGQEKDRRRTQEAGFDAHLVKPVAPAALVELLASLLGE